MDKPKAANDLAAELDRCVKCGMCLPECPTYRLAGNENESPRGRVALIEGLVQGRLQADAPLLRHLDSCLGCRRCERVCPSQVRYGHLIDQARGLLPRQRAARWAGWIRHPALLNWGTAVARALPTAMSRPFGPLHRLHEIACALPATQAAPAPGDYPPASAPARGRVGLFPGCVGAAQQGGALHATVRLLRHAGYAVTIPAAAGCCGALAQHAGDAAGAARLAAANRSAFDGKLDAVVSIASGCGNQLDSYDPPLAAAHRDICRFLLEHGDLAAADFAPLPQRALLHTPCSVENVYRGADWARRLLALIPDLQIEAVGEAGQCCGAAGDYMLRHADTAARLRQPILDQVGAVPDALLLTSNIGCAMHLAHGLRQNGSEVEVLHPVELLARQLKPTP